MERFADRLMTLATEKSLTQAQLAKKAGIDPSKISRIKGGKRSASPEDVDRLALVLEVSAFELVDGTDLAAELADYVRQHATRKELEAARSEAFEAKSDAEDARAQLADATVRLAELERELASCQASRRTAEAQLNTARQTVARQKHHVSLLHAGNAALRTHLSHAQTANAVLRRTADNAKTMAGIGGLAGLVGLFVGATKKADDDEDYYDEDD